MKSVFSNMAQQIIILLKRCVLNSRQAFSKHVDQGELEHCRVKRFYSRTSKAKFTEGISHHERRQRALHETSEKIEMVKNFNALAEGPAPQAKELPLTDPKIPYKISNETRLKHHIYDWVEKDPRYIGANLKVRS